MAGKKTNNPVYTGISYEELKALSSCGGEAVRIYLALSMRCYGNKSSGFASKETIIRDMGKEDLLICSKTGKEKNWVQPFNRKLVELVNAGLLDRGRKHIPWNRTNPWTLTLKKKIVSRRLNQKSSTSQQKGSGGRTNKVQDTNQKSSKSRTKKVQHNNKKNTKDNNKINNISNINEYEVEIEGRTLTFRRLPPEEDHLERWKLLNLLQEGEVRWLWYYEPEALSEWLKQIEKKWPYMYEISKLELKKFLEEWDINEID